MTGDSKFNIDKLDYDIILELQENARRPYKDIAAKMNVAETTVSNRVNKLQKYGVLKLEARVNPFRMDNKVAAVIGVILTNRNHINCIHELEQIPGVSAAYVATGKYDLFVEVLKDSIEELNQMLFGNDGLGGIDYILRTEAFIILNAGKKYFKLQDKLHQ